VVWAGNVACTGKIKYLYKILNGKCRKESYHVADLPSKWSSKQTVGIWTEFF
jgi:hypothetical protein